MQGKILLIVNPIAGKMRVNNYDIPSLFSGCSLSTYYTTDSGATETYVAENAGGYDTVICAGGDGTLSQVINGLMRVESPPALGYIPCGTTNDFAVSLGVPRDIPEAVALIQKNHPVPVDVGSFNDRFFSYVASFGAFTESSYKAPQESKNKLGRMAYLFEAMREFPRIRPCSLSVETDAGTFRDDYVFGAVSNATTLGGLLHLSPADVAYDDGLFEVLLIKMPRSVADFQQIVFSLMRQQYNADFITYIKTKSARFTMEHPVPWSLDGEYASGSSTVDIQIHPKAIRLHL